MGAQVVCHCMPSRLHTSTKRPILFLCYFNDYPLKFRESETHQSNGFRTILVRIDSVVGLELSGVDTRFKPIKRQFHSALHYTSHRDDCVGHQLPLYTQLFHR